jgi:hypothetical protein
VTLGALVLIVGIGVTAFVAGRAAHAVETVDGVVSDALDTVTGTGEFTKVGEVKVDSIRALAELTTIEMVEYTVVEKGDDRGWLNWAKGDKIEMFAVARIGAGVDLAGVDGSDIYADPATGRARILLPKAGITYVIVDNEATHVYNRETGVFTKGSVDLERSARLAAEDVLVAKAEEQGITRLAEERAKKVISDLLAGFGYTDIEVVIGT